VQRLLTDDLTLEGIISKRKLRLGFISFLSTQGNKLDNAFLLYEATKDYRESQDEKQRRCHN